MVVKNLRTIADALRKTNFCSCTYICECRSSFGRLEERGMRIIPVAGTINGTTYSALCFHMVFTFIARSWYYLHSVVIIIIITTCLIYAWLI
jgi:hypothetical protein